MQPAEWLQFFINKMISYLIVLHITLHYITQMLWSYISATLTNLGAMLLDRIHTMLKMFMTQGRDCTPAELKSFLDKKVKSQQLVYSGGTYHLN